MSGSNRNQQHIFPLLQRDLQEIIVITSPPTTETFVGQNPVEPDLKLAFTADVHRCVLLPWRIDGHNPVDDTFGNGVVSVFRRLLHEGGRLRESTHQSRRSPPPLPHDSKFSSSVTVPPLASDSKSVLRSRLASGNTAHNHGPSIFGPPIGNPGLLYQMSLYSHVTYPGAKSPICCYFQHVAISSWLDLQAGIHQYVVV